jgi:hypothetical protein
VSVLSKLPVVAKAISAGVLTFAASLSVALQDNSVSTAEWINVAVAAVIAAIGVWAVPNQTPDAPAE